MAIEIELMTPTEDEMDRFLATFQRMRDAIVAGSKLAQEFAELRGQVQALREDLDKVRNINATLDEALLSSRQARDGFAADLREANIQLTEANIKLNDTRREREEQRGRADAAEQLAAEQARTIEELIKHGDVAVETALRLREDNEGLRKQLETIREQWRGMAQVFDPVPPIGKYPSEREERAAMQPREDNGRFEQGHKPQTDDPSLPSTAEATTY